MKKFLSAILILSLMASLAACADSSSSDTVTDGYDSVTDTGDEVTTDIYGDLPTGDFGDEEFVFANETLSSSWALLTLDSQTIAGDVLDNAIYHRNRTVEERLGVKIRVEEYYGYDQLATALIKNVMSGEDPVDVYDIGTDGVTSMILQDYFVDIGTLGLDITKPWWNTSIMESLTFNDTCYSIAGDLSIMLWDASSCIMYNKDMAQKLNLPDQYQLVRDGKFTLDVLNEAIVLAYEDNGNTVVDSEDTFGMSGSDRFMTHAMVSGGQKFVDYDSDGLPVFNGITNRLSEMYEKIFNVYYNNDAVCIGGRITFKDSSKNWGTLFVDGGALYYFEPIGACTKLRDAGFDYGFLPMPKYDEEQEDYITPILRYVHTMYVTKANDRIDMIGVVLENLAAESHKNVRSVYFDKVLDGKRSKDDGTIEMFEIIFENRVLDPMLVYGWGGFGNALNSNAFQKREEVASVIESITSMVQADIQKTVDYYGQ